MHSLRRLGVSQVKEHQREVLPPRDSLSPSIEATGASHPAIPAHDDMLSSTAIPAGHSHPRNPPARRARRALPPRLSTRPRRRDWTSSIRLQTRVQSSHSSKPPRPARALPSQPLRPCPHNLVDQRERFRQSREQGGRGRAGQRRFGLTRGRACRCVRPRSVERARVDHHGSGRGERREEGGLKVLVRASGFPKTQAVQSEVLRSPQTAQRRRATRAGDKCHSVA